MDHTIKAGPILAKEQHIKRHDKSVCSPTTHHIQENMGKIRKEQWYEQVPKSV
jgi:hypothetical protein